MPWPCEKAPDADPGSAAHPLCGYRPNIFPYPLEFGDDRNRDRTDRTRGARLWWPTTHGNAEDHTSGRAPIARRAMGERTDAGVPRESGRNDNRGEERGGEDWARTTRK